MWPQDVLGRLERVRRLGKANRWVACCPAHYDRSPTLGIMLGSRGALILRCFAGCSIEDVLVKIGCKMSDLFPPDSRYAGPHQRDGLAQQTPRRIVKTYNYTDEDGKLLYQVCRTEPKGFFQRRPDGHGDWLNGLDAVRRVLYRLPKITKGTQLVIIVEGEKDVHVIEDTLGLVATTNAMGAGKWCEDYSRCLSGKDVLIIPDNDDPGREHAERVAGSLLRHRASAVSILELPGLNLHGDVADFVQVYGQQSLQKLIRQTRWWMS